MASATAPSESPATSGPSKRIYLTVTSIAMLTAAAIITSLRGLTLMADEELTMFVYIAFAVVLFLIPSALVAAELGGAFGKSKQGVGKWVQEAFGERWGFLAIWLAWIESNVFYPTGLAFAAAAAAYVFNARDLANNNIYVGSFCIIAYWLCTLVAFRGTETFAKLAKWGFIFGTLVPGVVLVLLAIWWMVTGHSPGWETASNIAVTQNGHPRFFPYITGMSSIAFLAGILLLFAGAEAQGVHVSEMKNPRRGFPAAVLLAALISVVIFTLGSLAVAAMLPYNGINLQTGVFSAFDAGFGLIGGSKVGPSIMALLICVGALSGVLAWITGPSKGLMATARKGVMPPFWQKTNKKGIQQNVLVIQGIVVTAISSIYFIIKDVSAAFFLISAMTIALYILMYLFMYAAAIYLRYSQPDLERVFRIGKKGNWMMWLVSGVGFLAVAFAFVLSFFPPSQLPVGSPALYVGLVAGGVIIFSALPLIIYAFKKPSWRLPEYAHDDDDTDTVATAASNG
ncbi:MAG: amino acid permease [Actinomycetes bacterium]